MVLLGLGVGTRMLGGSSRQVVCLMSQRSISSRLISEGKPKPQPFPYRQKRYTLLRSLLDRTTHRFDENSKIITVEGPIAAGKTAFAKELARQLDMHYIADANMDLRYINPYGYDMRKLDHLLPESTRSFDEKNFCQDPKHPNAAGFQIWMYRLRFSLYIDALAHVLNTGQGVVIQRCPWSDMVFMDAMASQGYVSKEVREAYWIIRNNTIGTLMHPHLVVYLNIPADTLVEKIKTNGESFEQNSKALTPEYIKDIETSYKTKFLPGINNNSELLMYDWTEGGDVEAIVEDIERIDLNHFQKHDDKLKDWRKPKEQAWSDTRMLYTNNKAQLMSLFNIPLMDVPELVISGEDNKVLNTVWASAPGMEYDRGFNILKGDKGVMFKVNNDNYVPY